MKRNEDPNTLFESLAAIKLLYSGTKIPLKDEEMKDTIFEKLLATYSNTLNTAEDLHGLWRNHPRYSYSYRILQKEVLKEYKVSHKNMEAGSQAREVVLFPNTGSRGNGAMP